MEPLTIDALRSWIEQFPPEAHLHANEGELAVVVAHPEGGFVAHFLATPCPAP